MSIVNPKKKSSIDATKVGDGLTLDPSTKVMSVTTPVRSILTPEQFDALPDDQKNSGFYILDDGNNQNGSGEGSGSSGSSEEIYSTEEMRIGTWIDGKPVYRRVVRCTTPNKANAGITVATINANIDEVISIYGTSRYIENGIEHKQLLNITAGANFMTTYVDDQSKIVMYCGAAYLNKSATVILEYTKTTD